MRPAARTAATAFSIPAGVRTVYRTKGVKSFRAVMPSPEELAERFGNPRNEQLFRFRDLLLLWQQQYIEENGGSIYDMHDESHHFSVYLS